ncbi:MULTISPECIES: transposase [Paenibacillus]|jgi:transposase|uniref:Transposase n=1 Tax=Paenibacillus polymyxa TaxID=1406 RepID=A0AAP4A2T0_PAEPO|nr:MULTISPECIES: transposase [Paenibacillus]MDH2333879.1 transposase [Paenibacillus polymyxa]
MPKQQRTFTAEFKKQIVQLYENAKPRADLVRGIWPHRIDSRLERTGGLSKNGL